MRTLELWLSYTRKEVHDIFSPDTPFTPQRGTWGLHGIVAIPERPKYLHEFEKRKGNDVALRLGQAFADVL